MNRKRQGPKRIRVSLLGPGPERQVLGFADIPLPADFTNFDTSRACILKIEQQVQRPEDIPARDPYAPDPLPVNYDGEQLPYYPYSYTLKDNWITQTDWYQMSTSGVVMFAEFEG